MRSEQQTRAIWTAWEPSHLSNIHLKCTRMAFIPTPPTVRVPVHARPVPVRALQPCVAIPLHKRRSPLHTHYHQSASCGIQVRAKSAAERRALTQWRRCCTVWRVPLTCAGCKAAARARWIDLAPRAEWVDIAGQSDQQRRRQDRWSLLRSRRLHRWSTHRVSGSKRGRGCSAKHAAMRPMGRWCKGWPLPTARSM